MSLAIFAIIAFAAALFYATYEFGFKDEKPYN